MSNELQKLNNPDNIPQGVTTGYQRQNTNMFAIQTGLDTTEPHDDGNGVITVKSGGIIENNGVMFKIVTDVTLTKPNINTAYWIEIVDNGNETASLQLVTRPGIWDSNKKGCYTINNQRTLNWHSLGNISNLTETAIYSKTNKGKNTFRLIAGWYYTTLTSGKGLGHGGSANGTTGEIGLGGIANTTKTLNTIFFNDGKKTINVSVGANGENGQNGQSSNFPAGPIGPPGGGGGSGSGEETTLNELTTGNVDAGNGGDAGTGNTYARGGVNGQHGENGRLFAVANVSNGAITHYFGAQGGNGKGYMGGAGGGGSNGNNTNTIARGGDGGIAGKNRPDGSDGGSCYIYPLNN